MHEREPNPSSPENKSHGPTPQIWAASLSDYNAGILHGAWIDAAQDPAGISADIDDMLARSNQPDAEEWAIHDYEAFGHIRLSEYEPLADLSRVALGIAEHGMAYAAWVGHHGEHPEGELFEDHFRGTWRSLADYAERYASDVGIDNIIDDHVPEFFRPYVRFDTESFGRDLELGGDVFSVDTPDGDIWIFDAT